jgi:hypothetical protein
MLNQKFQSLLAHALSSPGFLSGLCCAIALGLGVLASPVAAQELVGAQKCKSCHEFEFGVWAEGPHAKARESLRPAQLADSKCNTCHTMKWEQANKAPASVQCERCHGPGEYYHRPYVMRDRELARVLGLVEVKEAHCRQCHTRDTPSIRPFNFVEMWSRIDHGRAARLAWEKAQAGAPTEQ